MTEIDIDKLQKVMDLISFSQEQCQKFHKTDDFKNHNFNFFSNKPFYKLNNREYIPIDGKLSQNLIFNNFYYRVKSASEDKKAFMRDFGTAFEEYVVDLIEYVGLNSISYTYKHIPEFEYVNNKKSSDSYILYRDSSKKTDFVLVIEIKSARILDTVKRLKGDRNVIQKSINKLTLSPIKQAVRATLDVINTESHQEISKNKVYYFMSVSMDDFPLIYGDYDKDLGLDLSGINCGGLYSISIEEFELFVKLISSDFSFSFPEILDSYADYSNHLSFKNYLNKLKKSYHFENNKFDQMILRSQLEIQ